jgi:hypothetical protein
MIGDAADDKPSIGMAAKNDIRQFFPLDEIKNVGDMSR